jgi:hypothetical protein
MRRMGLDGLRSGRLLISQQAGTQGVAAQGVAAVGDGDLHCEHGVVPRFVVSVGQCGMPKCNSGRALMNGRLPRWAL